LHPASNDSRYSPLENQLKTDKPFIDAMREAARLVRTRGPFAATAYIQRLFGQPPISPGRQQGFGNDSAVNDAVEVIDAPAARETWQPVSPSREGQRPLPDQAELPADVGEFLTRRFESAMGARAYKLYLPSSIGARLTSRPLPLIVMLHGCRQDAEDFALRVAPFELQRAENLDALCAQRARARGLSESEYMSGNLLGREVTADDVARAFVHLALSAKTTGAILTVDGGNIAAAVR